MRLALQVVGWAFGLPLQILIITTLLRGGYRRFPFVFAYIVTDFVTTALEIPPALSYVRGMRQSATPLAFVYWIDEIVLQVLIYAVVVSFIYELTRHLPSRRLLRASVVAGAILPAAISFVIHFNPTLNTGSWMTPWTRDLNFYSAILDLGLWALLIASRSRDHQMLLLTGGLGIKFAGESIGESVRQLAIQNRSKPISLTGNVIIMVANIFFFYVWWHAVRTAKKNGSRPLAETAPRNKL